MNSALCSQIGKVGCSFTSVKYFNKIIKKNLGQKSITYHKLFLEFNFTYAMNEVS